MANRFENAVYVRKFLDQEWLLRCDYCDDSMYFASWWDALSGAHHHVARHKREQCAHCGAVPFIRYSEWP